MKRFVDQLRLFLILMIALAAFVRLDCDDRPDINISVDITVQPQGGSGVNTVTCTFRGVAVNNNGQAGPLVENATLTSTWWSTHGKYNVQTHVLTTHADEKYFTTSKSAPDGMYLDKPFWLVVSWTDKGGYCEAVSDTAYCQ